MNVFLKLAPVAFAVAFATTACSAHDEQIDETESVVEGELGGGAHLARGRYLVKGRPEAVRAINEVFLLPGGSFYADFRAAISNVSGHRFPAAGKYSLERQSGRERLVFTYSLDAQSPTGAERYELQRKASGDLELRYLESDGTTQEPFVLERSGTSDVATITFGSDWSVHQKGELVPGGVLELRYAMSRAKCDRPTVESLVSVDGARAQSLVFPGQAGAVATVAMPVPTGDHVTMWFRNVGAYPSCEAWDSDYGRNFTLSTR